jgi:DNA-binding winged helix-turn-helix (wHTH) protein
MVARRFKVGQWMVAPDLNSLERDGRTVRLEPKVMQVLVTLAECPGEVVTKEQLIHRVWTETFVTDDVLTRSISELRKAFEDNAREPTYIQTVAKGGYRILAPVVPEAA